MVKKKLKKRTSPRGVKRKKRVAAKKKVVKKSAPRKRTARKKASAKKRVPARKKTVARSARKKTTVTTAKKKKKPSAKKAAPASAARKARAKAKTVRKKSQARMVKPKNKGAIQRARKTAKGEAYMNKKQLRQFRELLLGRKKELMHEVDKTVNHMKADATNFADPADRATQEEEFSLELRTRDRERKLVKKIDAALKMIQDNEYGYCVVCGTEIGIPRLRARPTAILCIECKGLQELKEKQLAD